MIELRTLGQVAVSAAGTPVTRGAGAQRKPLALLALLAATGEQGMSRDRLLAYLWPDLDEERGRGVLRQVLYALRRDLEAPALFQESAAIRLNSERITTDIATFGAACRAKDWQGAIEEYRGPFLDGFYIAGAGEFERWVEAERGRLAEAFRAALEHAANEDDSSGPPEDAIVCWRRLAAEVPLDGRITARLMRALIRAGASAAAIECARDHERLVMEELGSGPDPAVSRVLDDIRAGARPVSPPVGTLAAGAPAPSLATPPPSLQPPAKAGARSRSRRLIWAVAAGIFVPGAFVIVASLRTRTDSTPPVHIQPVVAVVPFEDASVLAGERDLGGAVARELARQLGGLASLRVIGPEAAAPAAVGGDSLGALAGLGAGSILEGAVRQDGRGVNITARLRNASTGQILWSTAMERDLADLHAMQSDIARHVAYAVDGTVTPMEGQRLDRPPTADPAAYRAYLSTGGLSYSDRLENQAAIGILRRAVQRDPTFALAWGTLARRYLFLAYLAHPAYRDSCRAAVERALAADPDMSIAHWSLGDLQVLEGRPQTARFELLKALELAPSEVGAMADLSDADATIGRYDESLYWALLAVRLAPTSPPLYTHVGVPLLALGDDNATVRWLHAAEQRWPGYHRVQIGLARLELLEGKIGEALARMRRQAQRSPEDEETAVALAQMATLAGARDADSLVRLRLAASPDTRPYGLAPETFRTLLALLRRHAGDSATAQALLDTALTQARREFENGGEDPAPAVEAAAIHAVRGDIGTAVGWLKRAHATGWHDERWLRIDPLFFRIREDSAFQSLLRVMAQEVAVMRRRALEANESVFRR
jgi:DNA-binding SARP family transcriptional activator/TolB-like protein/Flp pilus assembly protein TadD